MTKEISIEYGHRVPNHQSKCRNIHGHSGLVRVHVEGTLVNIGGVPDEGMVIDFSDIKKLLMEEVDELFDHAFITCMQDAPLLASILGDKTAVKVIDMVRRYGFVSVADQNEFYGKLVVLDCIPTAENLARVIFEKLNAQLMTGAKVVKVEFWETKTSCAIVEGFIGNEL